MLDLLWIGGFCDEVDCAKCACMTCVGFVVLAREHQNARYLGVIEQVRNQGEAFIRLVLGRRQAEVDQGERWRRIQLRQKAFDLLAGFGHKNFEVVG